MERMVRLLAFANGGGEGTLVLPRSGRRALLNCVCKQQDGCNKTKLVKKYELVGAHERGSSCSRSHSDCSGIFLIVIGIGYFVGAGVAYSKVQGGYGSLQSFSEVQNVQLNYNEDGQLIDRGQVETAQAIMSLLEDDWNFPVVDGDMDPNDPLVNTASEYMYQMATISYHVLNDTQVVTLTQEDIDAAIASEQLAPDGTYEGVVAAYQGQVLEPRQLRRAGRRALLDRLHPDRPSRRPGP
jgi:hypothetical protein